MLSESEKLIFSVMGLARIDVRPMAFTLDILTELIFDKGMDFSDIRMQYDVYPVIAKKLGKSTCAVGRSVMRHVNLFWFYAEHKGMIEELFGRSLSEAPAPKEILLCLVFLLYYGKPLFSLVTQKLYF